MTEIKVTPSDTLLRYETPLYYGQERKSNGKSSIGFEQNKAGGSSNESATSKLDEMINSMLPLREWLEETGVWVQYVSKEPASRLDIITLQEQLDKKINDRKARETGICSVREELYKQCLDELIRQVALDGPERGLLLMRVRDEFNMTVNAYKTLFESSVIFGIKKQLKSEQGLKELEERAIILDNENNELGKIPTLLCASPFLTSLYRDRAA